MKIDRLVLTAASIEAIRAFHERTPGMETVTLGEGRAAPCCGEHRIGLHEAGHGLEPESRSPTPGPGDFRLVTDTPSTRSPRALPPAALRSRKAPWRAPGFCEAAPDAASRPGNGRRDPAGPVQYDPVPLRPAGRQWLEILPRSGRARSAGGSLAVPT